MSTQIIKNSGIAISEKQQDISSKKTFSKADFGASNTSVSHQHHHHHHHQQHPGKETSVQSIYNAGGALRLRVEASKVPSEIEIPPNVPSHMDPRIHHRKISDIQAKLAHEFALAHPKFPTEPTTERTFSMLAKDEAEAERKAERERQLYPDPPPPFQKASIERDKEEEAKRPRTPDPQEMFGGLILGLGKKQYQRAESPPKDYTYRGMVFREGVNLASEFPEGDKLKMTPYCVPNARRMKEMTRPYNDIGIRIAPTLSTTFGKSTSKTDKQYKNEEAGETGNPNLFVMFGKPEPKKPVNCPPLFATTYQLILDYIDEHNLEMLLQHLLALCLISLPEDPYAFMAEHIAKMDEAKNDPEKFKNLTRIFYPEHVHAMFRVFDKEQNGVISLQQYKIGMEALGLVRYTQEPEGYDAKGITEETFATEACAALELLLKSFMV